MESKTEKPHATHSLRMRGESVANLDQLSMLQTQVQLLLEASSSYRKDVIEASVHFFMYDLGLPHQYFDDTPVATVAKHLASLQAAKELATSSGRRFDLQLQQEEDDSAFFAARSMILADRFGGYVRKGDAALSPAVILERYIESKYLSQGENTRRGEDVQHGYAQFTAGKDRGMFSVSSKPDVASGAATPKEATGGPDGVNPWRLQCYRSKGVLADGAHLRLYFLQAPDFVNPAPQEGETRIQELADKSFLARTSPDLLPIYQKVLYHATTRMSPGVHVSMISDISEGEDSDVTGVSSGEEVPGVLLIIGHQAGSTHSYFTGTPDVYRWYGFFAVAKYVEVFSNGVIIFTFRLRMLDFSRAQIAAGLTPTLAGLARAGPYAAPPEIRGHMHSRQLSTMTTAGGTTTQDEREGQYGAPAVTDRRAIYTGGAADAPSLEDRMHDLKRDVALHFVLPRTSVTPLLNQGVLSAQEAAYAYAAWKFAFHFTPRMSDELNALLSIVKGNPALGERQTEAVQAISKLRKNVQSHSYTESQILDAIYRYPDLIAWLYRQFAARHKPANARKGSAAKLPTDASQLTYEQTIAHVKKAIKSSDDDLVIFTSFARFNFAILKSNFYRSHIVALSFRLEPTFLSADYPDKPYGIFYVIGAEFRGFHVRFADVARGGIRLVKSASPQAYASNLDGLFSEVYSLANTQQRKNKDIPEGGSKGICLLNLAHQDKAKVAFSKYIDAILDLLLLPCDEVIDRLGAPEILFCGPDENTADLMDWACLHARKRSYPYWKAFTTGKSTTLGGIPHDVHGMTTQGVRAYVTGIQRKLILDPARLTKVQTGGPDGDLGSNEIKLGKEKTIAVVDGSGVLCDPEGIQHAELLRLAEARRMVKEFDRSQLGGRGFLVLVEDTDVKLPDGTLVPSGLAFRNNFHTNALVSADFFVPCGGRPAAVNTDNVDAFLYGSMPDGSAAPVPADENRKRQLRFRYIVEGANLFFTNDARLAIESKGVILFKDASANKGGVTSSSLEVLVALALTDAEFSANMCVPEGGPAPDTAPLPFYRRYVAEVQQLVQENAALEFECLWREHQRTRTPISLLSDQLSIKITDLSSRIEESNTLWSNIPLRMRVLRDALPSTLSGLVGGTDVIISRLPENYLRALFGSRLASRFIYQVGLDTPAFAFFEYVDMLMKGSSMEAKPMATS